MKIRNANAIQSSLKVELEDIDNDDGTQFNFVVYGVVSIPNRNAKSELESTTQIRFWQYDLPIVSINELLEVQLPFLPPSSHIKSTSIDMPSSESISLSYFCTASATHSQTQKLSQFTIAATNSIAPSKSVSSSQTSTVSNPHPLSLTVTIPDKFDLKQDRLPLKIDAYNGSPASIESIELRLRQRVFVVGEKFVSNSEEEEMTLELLSDSDMQSFEISYTVSSAVFMGIDPNDSITLDDICVILPENLPSSCSCWLDVNGNLKSSNPDDSQYKNVLSVSYFVEAVLKTPEFSSSLDLSVVVPITLLDADIIPEPLPKDIEPPPLPPRLSLLKVLSPSLDYSPSPITSSSKSQSLPFLNQLATGPLFNNTSPHRRSLSAIVTPSTASRSSSLSTATSTPKIETPINSTPLTLHHWVSSTVLPNNFQLFYFEYSPSIFGTNAVAADVYIYMISNADAAIRISKNVVPTFWRYEQSDECRMESESTVDIAINTSPAKLAANEEEPEEIVKSIVSTEQEYLCKLRFGFGRYFIKVFGTKIAPNKLLAKQDGLVTFRISATLEARVDETVGRLVEEECIWKKVDMISRDSFLDDMADAWVVGFDVNGEALYAVRARVGRSLQIGKIGKHLKKAMVTYGGRILNTENFEVLCENPNSFNNQAVKSYLTDATTSLPRGVRWVKVIGPGPGIPPNAIPFGFESNGEKLYLSRAMVGDQAEKNFFVRLKKGSLCPGKAGNHLKHGASVPWNGRETSLFPFEVLVYDSPMMQNQVSAPQTQNTGFQLDEFEEFEGVIKLEDKDFIDGESEPTLLWDDV
ncbi:hypothetical protein HK098_000208 [Nowakowskiella sp. JEL0407]|nr:hypothetical protein HK098_000208 [Nowakowskiella sp. JEL0407]